MTTPPPPSSNTITQPSPSSSTDPSYASDPSTPAPLQIHLTVPPHLYTLPLAGLLLGGVLGLTRGARRASLRFLAENAHRPPTTVRGWYFYNKTKNYRVMMGALRGGGAEAVRVGAVAGAWVAAGEGARVLGVREEGRDVLAGAGTGGVFSLVYRLPWKAAGRTVLLGLIMGCMVSGLRVGQDWLRVRAALAKAEVDAAAAEGRAEVMQGVQEAASALQKKP